MTVDPPDLEPKKRVLMPHSLLEITMESLEKGWTKILNAITIIRKVTRRLTAGQKGAGKEGQGPRSRAKKEHKKEMASTVVEERVWMVIASDSGDEQMVNNEFDDFTISEEKLFYEDEDRNIRPHYSSQTTAQNI